VHPRRSSSRRTFLGNSRNADGPRRVTCESASLNFAVRSCEGCEGGTADSKDTSIVSETNNLDMFLSIAKPHAHGHETARNGVVNMHLKANSGAQDSWGILEYAWPRARGSDRSVICSRSSVCNSPRASAQSLAAVEHHNRCTFICCRSRTTLEKLTDATFWVLHVSLISVLRPPFEPSRTKK